MKNPKNQSTKAILSSDIKGMGNAAHLAESHTFEGNTFSMPEQDSITLSDNVLKALFIRNLHKDYKTSSQASIAKLLAAYSNDYLTTVHASTGSSPTDNPLAPTGKVISAEQYQLGYIRAGFTTDNSHTIQGILSDFRAINDKTSKGELTKMLASFAVIFESAENYENYAIIAANEARDAEKLEELTSLGLINISRLKSDSGKSAFSGRVALADASTLVQSLPKAGYTILSSETDMATFELVISIEES